MENLAAARLPNNPKNGTMASFGDDSGVHATFDDEFVKNEYKSDIEGRVIFDHFYIIELQWPGDNTKTFKYRFTPEEGKKGNHWIERFPRQWDAFNSSKEQTPDGTPIELWPPLDKRRVYELKAAKVFTVEQIAAMSDTQGTSLGLDWRKLRDQAKAFLNPEVGMVQISKLSRENEDLKSKMEAMAQQIAALAGDETNLPKKRGRKPKVILAA